ARARRARRRARAMCTQPRLRTHGGPRERGPPQVFVLRGGSYSDSSPVSTGAGSPMIPAPRPNDGAISSGVPVRVAPVRALDFFAAGLRRAGLRRAAGLRAAGLRAAGLRRAGLRRPAGLLAAGLRAAGLRRAGLRP